MNKATPTTSANSAISPFRRQPLYAATRLRCAIAMMLFAVAVSLSALPSLASDEACGAAGRMDTCTTAALYQSAE